MLSLPGFMILEGLRDARTCHSRIAAVQVEKEDMEFEEEFMSNDDPSILHFLLASGEEVSTRPPS